MRSLRTTVRGHAAFVAMLLVLAASVASAPHGDESEEGDMPPMTTSMQMDNSHAALPGSNANLTMADGSPMRPSYFRLQDWATLMYAHIMLMIVAWIIILPIATMLSVARSKLKIPAQVAFLAVNALGILVGIVYDGETPDLYPGNAHHPLGWAITWIALVWVLMGVVPSYLPSTTSSHTRNPSQHRPLLRAYDNVPAPEDSRMKEYRWSGDSGQGTERNTASLNSSRTQSWNSADGTFSPSSARADQRRQSYHDLDERYDEEDDQLNSESREKPPRIDTVDSYLQQKASKYVGGLGGRALYAFQFVHVLLERTVLILGFLGMCTGGAVYGGIFRDHYIFSGLAHWIKGGIFVWYGLFAFGRWMGCFADFGWAWNRKPDPSKYSAEFWESFVIFFYGASNVWLEHLGSWGGAWTAIDFQHLSITIMFFGGGLLGMLIESRRVRALLNSTALSSVAGVVATAAINEPDSYAVSLNPVPALIILLLGILMSSHEQHNMVATMIHKQWGMLFTAGSMARGVTYLTMWLKPPTSILPSRPPSEIVASFCILSGGAIFMASSENTVDVLRQNHLGAMFIFTVTMGLTSLVLAWELVVLAIKGWAVQRQSSPRTQSSA